MFSLSLGKSAWERLGPLYGTTALETNGTSASSFSPITAEAADHFLLNVNILSLYAPDRIPISPFAPSEPIIVLRWGSSVSCTSSSLWRSGTNVSWLSAHTLPVNQSAILPSPSPFPDGQSGERLGGGMAVSSSLEPRQDLANGGVTRGETRRGQQPEGQRRRGGARHPGIDLEVYLYLRYASRPSRGRRQGTGETGRPEKNILLAMGSLCLDANERLPGEAVHLALYDRLRHRAGHVTLALSEAPQLTPACPEVEQMSLVEEEMPDGKHMLIILPVCGDMAEATIAIPAISVK
eukprot:TRINITY_DN4870_c0_g1_i1.p1 TRINITY_DN4870_c0_g1~~TRINITY_DN4870_c0_g1_i1.p1  ORF type:complete len:294 (+),score=36.02 TRINITY_DN4870_c0_g1_i1:499-1380(+)